MNAQLLQKEHLIGTIEAGKFADIIAVAKDPLKDISELERVKFVMLGAEKSLNLIRLTFDNGY